MARVQEAIEGAGAATEVLATLQIEQSLTKLKGLLRTAQARTLETLWSAIGSMRGRWFAPDECERYIRHCGYCQSV